MTRLEDADKIEGIVGAKRHATRHLARAVSDEQRVYILHSKECRDSGIDLRECEYSIALDRGIEHAVPWEAWRRVQDRPVRVQVFRGWLMPELLAMRSATSTAEHIDPDCRDGKHRACPGWTLDLHPAPGAPDMVDCTCACHWDTLQERDRDA